MKTYSGYLITFEGPEGGGKSLHVSKVADYLKNTYGLDVVVIREPGGTEIGEQIRGVVHDIRNTKMTRRTESLLYLAARAQIVGEVVFPALEKGKIVLADRFQDSSVAYQGYARGLGCGWVDKLNNWATDGLVPDLTLLLDVDVETGLKRKKQQQELNRLDREEVSFHQAVRYAYLVLAENDEAGRWEKIDTSKSENEVFQAIISLIEEKLAIRGFIERPRNGLER